MILVLILQNCKAWSIRDVDSKPIHLFLCNYIYFDSNLWRCSIISEIIINEQIRDKEIRVIDENGNQLGIMTPSDALKLARESNLDLIKVAPMAKPPVCKIIDFGKYKYEITKREKKIRKSKNN